jgi:hypothetical protein
VAEPFFFSSLAASKYLITRASPLPELTQWRAGEEAAKDDPTTITISSLTSNLSCANA